MDTIIDEKEEEMNSLPFRSQVNSIFINSNMIKKIQREFMKGQRFSNQI